MSGFKVGLEILWHLQHITVVRGKFCETRFFGFRILSNVKVDNILVIIIIISNN